MKLLRAIEIADSLYPNQFSQEEKLRWCEELSAGIRRDVKKVYTTVELRTSSNGEIHWPDNFSFEDLELAFWNGSPMDKMDLRSFMTDASGSGSYGTLRLVFLEQPQPVRRICIQGEFDLSEHYIKMPDSPFEVGDFLEIATLSDKDAKPDWDTAVIACVMECTPYGFLLDEDIFTPQTATPLAIRRIIDDCTEVEEPPYDSMYVEYLLAKMALYQHDYSAYAAHITQYNTLYDALRRDYKTRTPLTAMAGFRRYW